MPAPVADSRAGLASEPTDSDRAAEHIDYFIECPDWLQTPLHGVDAALQNLFHQTLQMARFGEAR
jgi:hypothetical protein